MRHEVAQAAIDRADICRLSGARKPRRVRFDQVGQVCIVHTLSGGELLRQLERDGWQLANVRGSHHVFRHPAKPGHISVPHPRKDLGKGLAHKLMKTAGLK